MIRQVFDFAMMWYDTEKAPRLAHNSKMAILNALKNHILPTLGKICVADVKPIHIRQVTNSVKDLSQGAQSKVIVNLKAIFNFAVDNNLILKSPVLSTVKASGAPAAEKRSLTPGEASKLIEDTKGTRAHLFVLLGLMSGLRREEIYGLQWCDIDFHLGVIHVKRAVHIESNQGVLVNLKSASANRDIPIPSLLKNTLKEAQAITRSIFVISKQDGGIMSGAAHRQLWEIAEKYAPAGTTAHILWHTYITRLFEAGLDIKEVQRLAGYADPTITMKIYTHYCESRNDSTAKKIMQYFG